MLLLSWYYQIVVCSRVQCGPVLDVFSTDEKTTLFHPKRRGSLVRIRFPGGTEEDAETGL